MQLRATIKKNGHVKLRVMPRDEQINPRLYSVQCYEKPWHSKFKTLGGAKRSACMRSKRDPGIRYAVQTHSLPLMDVVRVEAVYLDGRQLNPLETAS